MAVSTSVPIAKSAAEWRTLVDEAGSAADEAAFDADYAEDVYSALDLIDRAADGREDDATITLIFTAEQYAVLEDGGWLWPVTARQKGLMDR